MGDELPYRVFPHEPKPVPPKPVPQTRLTRRSAGVKGVGEAGCIVAIAVFIPLFLLGNYLSCSGLCDARRTPEETFKGIVIGGFLSLVSACAVVWLVDLLLKRRSIARWEPELHARALKAEAQRHAKETKKEKALVEEEAASVTAELRSIYEASAQLAAGLGGHVGQASGWLKQAEAEYDDNAALLFWDAVENAAFHLASFKKSADELSAHARLYSQKLNGRRHDFPPFPLHDATTPDLVPLLHEFRRVTRLGHANTHFTEMLVHRKPQEFAIPGFYSLVEAMRNLPSSITASLSDLQEATSKQRGQAAPRS